MRIYRWRKALHTIVMRIGCLDRSTGAVYNVARCGRYVGGRNRVFGQSRYVTCKTRR